MQRHEENGQLGEARSLTKSSVKNGVFIYVLVFFVLCRKESKSILALLLGGIPQVIYIYI